MGGRTFVRGGCNQDPVMMVSGAAKGTLGLHASPQCHCRVSPLRTLETDESMRADLRSALDIQFKRIAEMQAQLDQLLAMISQAAGSGLHWRSCRRWQDTIAWLDGNGPWRFRCRIIVPGVPALATVAVRTEHRFKGRGHPRGVTFRAL